MSRQERRGGYPVYLVEKERLSQEDAPDRRVFVGFNAASAVLRDSIPDFIDGARAIGLAEC
jgi:hypothetical protein